MTSTGSTLAVLMRRGHRALNLLVLLGLVVQFWAAGWAAFGRPFTFHAVLGWSLMPVALLSLLTAAAAHRWERRTLWAAILLLLLVLQPIFVFVISSVSIALAALHPVNGLAAFCVALYLHLGGSSDRERRPADIVSPAILAAVAVLLQGACAEGNGGDDGWSGTVDTTEGGTIVVTNPSLPRLNGARGWTLREELRIGSMMGDSATAFGRIEDLHPHPDGGVYVLDAQARQVYLFAADGTLRQSIGGPGEGPGEFRQPVTLATGRDGGLRVADMGTSRVTVFDEKGDLVETHPLPSGVRIYPWLGELMQDGGVVAPLLRTAGDQPQLELVRFDSDSRPIDTLSAPVFGGDVEPGVFELSNDRGRMTVRVPYSPSLAWTIDPSGGFWVAPTTADYVIHRIDFAGDTLLTIVRPGEAIPVSGAEIDSAIASLRWFTDQGGKIDRSQFPSTKPALTGLFVTEDGMLVVEPTTAAFGSGWQAPARVLDVFDDSGRYLTRLELPDGVRTEPARPAFAGDTVYAVRVDELDVPYVTRYLRETGAESPTGQAE